MRKTFFTSLVLTVCLVFAFIFSLPDGKLHLVFCDVGEGDAAYIRTPNGQDMLIDGGPNARILDCLGKHMPFYDRTIDLVLLSHPQKDHFGGLKSVVERYKVKYFISSPIAGEGEAYQRLFNLIREKKIPVKVLYAGDKFMLGKVEFDVLWPEKEWVVENLNHTSDLSYLGESNKILGFSTNRDLNDFSYYLHLSYGQFDVIFTGDGGRNIQSEIKFDGLPPDIEVLKFPHHGSKTGVLPDFLEAIKPKLAVISVGKNSYGHPSDEALKLLLEHNVRIKRTDQDGNVEIISDGEEWGVN